MIEVLHLIKMPAQVTELGAISVKNDVVFFERNDIFELVSGRDLYHILGIKVKTWSDHVLFLFARIYIVEFGVNDLGMACKVSLLIDHWHIDPVTIRLESKGSFRSFLLDPALIIVQVKNTGGVLQPMSGLGDVCCKTHGGAGNVLK